MRRVEGEVQQVQCSTCAACFPTFVFSGDSDMVTAGLEAATSVEPPFVVLGQLNADELNAEYADGRERFSNRMSERLGQHLVVLSVARWTPAPSAKNMTFQQFQQAYRLSEPIYFCREVRGRSCGGDPPTPGRLRRWGGGAVGANRGHRFGVSDDARFPPLADAHGARFRSGSQRPLSAPKPRTAHDP